jgi:hypothetical protein
MAVHDDVFGPQIRTLAKAIGCSIYEARGIVISLWRWSFDNADDVGRIISADKFDIAKALSLGLDERYDAELVVDALVSSEWLCVENGEFVLPDWENRQAYYYKMLKRREDDAKRKREARQKAKDKKEAKDNEQSEDDCDDKNEASKPDTEIISEDATPNTHKDTTKPSIGYTSKFEEFWAVYPRHKGKKEAFSKYKARLKSGWSDEELYEAAVNYRNEVMKEKRDEQFVKHASTFLSTNEAFTDYIHRKASNAISEEKQDTDLDYAKLFKEWGGEGDY